VEKAVSAVSASSTWGRRQDRKPPIPRTPVGPTWHELVHVDMMRVSKDERIVVNVRVELRGTSTWRDRAEAVVLTSRCTP